MAAPDDMHYDIVARAFADGDVVPFLGAGASLADRDPSEREWTLGVGLPNGRELAAFLAKRTGVRPEGPAAGTSAPAALDLAQVSQWVEALRGEQVLYRHLHELFAGAYRPTSAHRFLTRITRLLPAETRPRLFITTNYDDGLEQALASKGIEHDLVWYRVAGRDRAENGFVHRAPGERPVLVALPDEYRGIDLDERPVVLKIHGAVDRDHPDGDSFVITEDNYIDYLGRADPWEQLPIDLRAEIKLKSFLFMGYGLHDWNLRVLLNRIWAERHRSLAHWAIQFKPSRLDEKLWIHRGNVELWDAPLRVYATTLERRLRDFLAAGTLP